MATNTKARKTAGGNAFTKAWLSLKGEEITKGAKVRHKDGAEGVVVGRHTRPKDRVPMILIELAGAPSGAPAKSGKKKKGGPARTSVPAAEVEVVTKSGE